ncbi:hypothetical protein [Variovorax soli]|uniref:Uncharacterized protein n=1 Tax=Variovorax soli TaxID=376815 RepID=A0ABU1NFT5_9BURK|nr:hypothetical protein [Variovorax soli]MDR6537289.1 hypothetical protein [Variovorax soli]
MKLPRDWLKELELLTWRFAGMGITPDLASMTMVELAGLYLYLRRLSGA